jgi:malate/lactate dehydrogenase
VKVAIVGGAGGVGSSTAFNLVLLQGGHEIVLVDRRPEMITSHLMDLEQVLELSPGCTVNEGAAADLPDSDVVVVLSSSPLTVGMSRLDYLAKNARIVDELGDLFDPAWPGILIVVTNPVDPLVTRLYRRTSLDRHRIVGYTINDSLRLCTGVAKALGAASGTVEAWAVGEHGDHSVPLLDRVTVNGSPVELTPEQAAVALDYFRNWFVRHVALDSGRSSTWTSGFALARMVSALESGAVENTAELWPASVVLDGEYGIAGVAVSVPVTLGTRGVELIHEWELTPSDLEALRASAQYVRTAVESSEE